MITIKYKGKDHTASKYCSIGEFLEKHDPKGCESLEYMDNPIVAGLANSELLPLSARLNHSFQLEEVRLFSDLGKRIYRTSICYLMNYAASLLYPNKHLVIGHSLGDGYYYTFDDECPIDEKTIAELSSKMHELAKARLPIERRFLAYETAIEHFSSRGFEDTVRILRYNNDPDVACYKINDYYDISLEVLVPNTATLTLWELKGYGGNGMLLRYPRSSDFKQLRPFTDNPLLFNVFKEYRKWGKILGIQSIGDLDSICYDKDRISEYILLSESLQARKIASIADDISSKPVKIVLISGPSSSGKTTFARKLCLQLKMLGHEALRISLDNYYMPHDQIPRMPDGKPDFEAYEAIDTETFRHELSSLLDGDEVRLSCYDFSQRGHYLSESRARLNPGSIVVVEGIHGLNPSLLPSFSEHLVYRIYISALTQINLDDHTRLSTTDNRLLRRLVRDARARDIPALTTLKMWSQVQSGANMYIFPYQNNANVILNSALDYEISVLAGYASPLLKEVKPTNEEYYTTARRLLKILDNVHPLPERLVPKDSLLREFIGGSIFGD